MQISTSAVRSPRYKNLSLLFKSFPKLRCPSVLICEGQWREGKWAIQSTLRADTHPLIYFRDGHLRCGCLVTEKRDADVATIFGDWSSRETGRVATMTQGGLHVRCVQIKRNKCSGPTLFSVPPGPAWFLVLGTDHNFCGICKAKLKLISPPLCVSNNKFLRVNIRN